MREIDHTRKVGLKRMRVVHLARGPRQVKDPQILVHKINTDPLSKAEVAMEALTHNHLMQVPINIREEVQRLLSMVDHKLGVLQLLKN